MLVVFDLDGTVVDSTETLLEAHRVAWSSVGCSCPSPEAILELIGLPLDDIMKKLGPDQDPEHLAELYSKAYVEAAHLERLFDGMAELLAKPFRAAVATGKSQRAERVIEAIWLRGRFEIVLGGNSVPRAKPHPRYVTCNHGCNGDPRPRDGWRYHLRFGGNGTCRGCESHRGELGTP